ncbi:MAG TPA: hypothetical protein VIL85_20635 [Thermomicrobiales bacterium]
MLTLVIAVLVALVVAALLLLLWPEGEAGVGSPPQPPNAGVSNEQPE